MTKSPIYLLAVSTVLALSGCASGTGIPADAKVDGSNQGGASQGGSAADVGGNAPAAGGVANSTGGMTGLGGAAATGGNESKGGSLSTGGTPAQGGSVGKGGASATGGTASTGGNVGKGGAATGGSRATGGATSSGGSQATGGTTATAGAGNSLPKFVGNITTGNGVDSGSLKYATYWDQITPENAGKWGSVQSSPSSAFNWGSLDTVYKYAETNKILFKHHCFVWGSQQPSGTPTLAQVEAWIKAYCERYPNTKIIDVVNEPPPHTTPSYTSNLGAGETGTYPWITKAFKLARQYCPNAILVLNDYNTIEWTNDNSHFIDIVKDIKAAGAPIDAVGAQSHDLDKSGVTFSTVQTLLAKLHNDTSLPVYITELDLSYTDDATQLAAYKQYMPLFMDADYVKGITIWGWIYGSTWSMAPDSGLVRSGKSRSAMTYLMDLLKRPAP